MIEIRIGDLNDPQVESLLNEHQREMHTVSVPESCHALDVCGLRGQDITFWTAHAAGVLAGCAALKQIDPTQGEVKSMRTLPRYRGQGIGQRLLDKIIETARQRGYQRLSLETGSMDFFVPARKLYEKSGFVYCEPFADYVQDPNSLYMTLELS